MGIDKTLYYRAGGRITLERVHKIFYDKVYAHPWLSQYFEGKEQTIIENQQTDFMTQLMGGPQRYMGRAPKFAHQHMVITDELFELRSQLLSESIQEAYIADDIREEWLAADAALKRALVKHSAEECTAYSQDEILDFKKPA